MANWFAVYKVSDGSLMSAYSDDAQQVPTTPQLTAAGLAQVAIAGPPGTQVWNPGTKSFTAAVATAIQTLAGKASSSWTVQDVADWLKAKG